MRHASGILRPVFANFALLALAGCGPSPAKTRAEADGGAPAEAGLAPNAPAQCQFRSVSIDVSAGSKKGKSYTGQLHVSAKQGTDEIAGVLLGPPVTSGVQQRLPLSGTVTGTTVALSVLLPDADTLDLAGTLDAPLPSCSGNAQGAIGSPSSGTWKALGARPPPPDAAACVAHGADPLVCGIYQN